jgi:hypothetical protein
MFVDACTDYSSNPMDNREQFDIQSVPCEILQSICRLLFLLRGVFVYLVELPRSMIHIFLGLSFEDGIAFFWEGAKLHDSCLDIKSRGEVNFEASWSVYGTNKIRHFLYHLETIFVSLPQNLPSSKRSTPQQVW